MTTEALLNCSRCGNPSKVEQYSSINVSETPELKEKVKDGSLFMWECPHCGTPNLVRSQLLYHDPSEKLMVWITGGSPELESRIATAYAGIEEMSAYTARFVADAGSLIEKVKIFDSGLDDIIMEMCKYVTKMEICDQNKENAEAIMDAAFKFLKLDGADNEITLAYPLDGQMQMIEVGFKVYEDCRGIINRNPAILESAKGFVRIDSEWLAAFFR